jgi:hypothetical protein
VISLDWFGSFGLTPLGFILMSAVSGLAGPGAIIALAAGLLAARSGKFATAVVAGAAASATRPTGIAVALALASVPTPRRLLAALLAIGGLAAFALWCARTYGDALAFVHIQATHGRVLSLLGPLRALFSLSVDPDYYVVTVAAIAAAVLMVRRTPPWVWLTAWLLLLLPLATGTMHAMVRYQPNNVPLLCGTAAILHGRRFWLVIALSLALMCVEALLYGQGHAHY